jgi:hypothetical protein
MIRTNRGGALTGRAFVFDLVGGAGGRQKRGGDYLFRDGNLLNQVNAGLWGIMRVHGTPRPTSSRSDSAASAGVPERPPRRAPAARTTPVDRVSLRGR